ncbi:BC1881 family protein [Fusobacterium mortiferum]|uniref:BC1881 family protein n=1 Tax=Fusobacterium mortiferum ATCC 9817 TaxID=469616 RepID=A0ABM6TY52_FUSMR|nr:BC1881 family protein [Fusobacterium mortiferum]AVQ19372.1 BC1881 family protein [Fusobacterium mortiferum ATCC 9817]EEO36217.1 hypothetical protein FMAG_01779 [Fusobacterium mortiferum ATCC 9817]
MKNKNNLSSYSTKELYDELIKRGGVNTYFLEPYEKWKLILKTDAIELEGPATILVVID